MNVFVLEDEIDRYPRNQIITVLSAKHAIDVARSCEDGKTVFSGPYDLLLLDHDMGGFYEDSAHPNTGYQFLKWLLEEKKLTGTPQIVLHSQNPVGRKNMRSILLQYKLNCDEFPFGPAFVTSLTRLKG